MAARIVPKGVISAWGEIYAKNSVVTMASSDAAFLKVESFSANGESLNMTPDQANNQIQIDVAGTYMVMCSLSVENSSGQAHVIEVSMFKDNGSTEFPNIHAHRSLAAAADKGSISISGIVNLIAGEVLDMRILSGSGVARNIIVSDITLSLRRIGD